MKKMSLTLSILFLHTIAAWSMEQNNQTYYIQKNDTETDPNGLKRLFLGEKTKVKKIHKNMLQQFKTLYQPIEDNIKIEDNTIYLPENVSLETFNRLVELEEEKQQSGADSSQTWTHDLTNIDTSTYVELLNTADMLNNFPILDALCSQWTKSHAHKYITLPNKNLNSNLQEILFKKIKTSIKTKLNDKVLQPYINNLPSEILYRRWLPEETIWLFAYHEQSDYIMWFVPTEFYTDTDIVNVRYAKYVNLQCFNIKTGEETTLNENEMNKKPSFANHTFKRHKDEFQPSTYSFNENGTIFYYRPRGLHSPLFTFNLPNNSPINETLKTEKYEIENCCITVFYDKYNGTNKLKTKPPKELWEDSVKMIQSANGTAYIYLHNGPFGIYKNIEKQILTENYETKKTKTFFTETSTYEQILLLDSILNKIKQKDSMIFLNKTEYLIYQSIPPEAKTVLDAQCRILHEHCSFFDAWWARRSFAFQQFGGIPHLKSWGETGFKLGCHAAIVGGIYTLGYKAGLFDGDYLPEMFKSITER